MTSDGLPGMWERADFERGKTDAEVGPSDLSMPAPQPNPSSEPKVTVTGVDGVTRIVQGVEGEIPDGVEYTFGPCDTCGEMFCEHERVSQPVVSSSRAVDLDLDAIGADLADPGVVGLRKLGTVGTGPLCRLVADVPALVAEVRRLRERNRWLEQRFIDQAHTLHAERRNELLDSLEAVRAERDAARAEAERLRERIDGQAETISKLGQVAAEAGRVMEALQAHGPSIVGHLLDTDDNAGERLRELLREVSEWALNGTTASTPLRAEIERLREAWRGESEHGHSTEACCSCCYQVNAERAEAARVREALQAVRGMHLACMECEGNGRCGWCHCCDAPWPCATVRALDAALDGEQR